MGKDISNWKGEARLQQARAEKAEGSQKILLARVLELRAGLAGLGFYLICNETCDEWDCPAGRFETLAEAVEATNAMLPAEQCHRAGDGDCETGCPDCPNPAASTNELDCDTCRGRVPDPCAGCKHLKAPSTYVVEAVEVPSDPTPCVPCPCATEAGAPCEGMTGARECPVEDGAEAVDVDTDAAGCALPCAGFTCAAECEYRTPEYICIAPGFPPNLPCTLPETPNEAPVRTGGSALLEDGACPDGAEAG